MLPLFSFAAVASLIYVSRRIRHATAGRRNSHPSPPPAGTTYFSLHFLALAFIAATTGTETNEFDQTISSIVKSLPPNWLRMSDSLPDLVFEFVALSLLVSGPLLLLSAIGALLARRCAASLQSGSVSR